MSTEANKAIVRRYVDQLNRRNEAIIDELIAVDFTLATLHATPTEGAGPATGREIVRQGYLRNITAFPDYQVTLEDLIAEDDTVVMHWTHRGTHQGRFLGIPATGREFRGAAVSIYRIVDGTITGVRALWDRVEVWQQLGILPDDERLLGWHAGSRNRARDPSLARGHPHSFWQG